jgi:two-component system, sensor histidine kinase and response regulator
MTLPLSPIATYSKVSEVQPCRLLVVDDLPDNSFLIQAILEEQGYLVEIADEGQDALKRIVSDPPDLVLLDVMMPDINGYEVTQQIRNNPNLPFIPILLITAYDHSSVVQGLDLGADDFVRKPVEVDELLARVRALLRLKQSIDERDRISRQREDFVSRLAHDLRTPLIAADRMLLLLFEGTFGELPTEANEALEMMSRNNKNLLQLVNKLLQVYRFEAGQQRLNFTDLDLVQLLQEVIQELLPLMKDKGLVLHQEIEPDFPKLEGDRLELRRVLTNLIGNAIHYTEAGSITVRLTRMVEMEAFDPTQWMYFAVEDTGIGISQQQQQQLFEPFRPGTDQRSGSGLGLYLSRYIVEAHHGALTVKSELQQGSCFTVCLPMVQPTA